MSTTQYSDTPTTMQSNWTYGLIPSIAHDADTGEVLMMAWMNEDELRLTLAEKRNVHWSRSRKCLWRKGETSGNIQRLITVRLECGGDTLLRQVNQIGGGACHTGRGSYFFTRRTIWTGF